MEQTNEAIVQAAEEIRAHKRKKRPLAILLVLVLLLAAAYAGLCAWATYSDTIWHDVDILGQNVGGLTVDEAASKLETALPTLEIDIYLYEDGQSPAGHSKEPDAVIPVSALGPALDAYTLALRAYQMDRASFWHSGLRYLESFRYHGNSFFAQSTLTLDEALTADAAEACTDSLSWEKQDASYALLEKTLTFSAPKDGRTVDKAVLTEKLSRIDWSHELALDIPYTVVPAKVLSAQELHNTLAAEMQNASYDAAADSIVPERIGVKFDPIVVQSVMDRAAPGETVQLPAIIRRPTVTAAELKSVLFRDVLGECQTRVSGTTARRTNVQLASAAFNNVVMNAGDVFSYNEALGQRTAEKGYQAAPAYIRGETVDEIGGGICQASSTLYLACLRANLEITERYPHRYTPAYIPWGMDATVSWGGPDYKFTNNTDYPIRILTKYENNTLTVTLLGTNVTGITAKVTNEQLSTTPYEVVYEEDPTLAPGQEKEKTSPYNGALVKTYRHLYDADGKLISSAFEATSNYKVRNQVILRGPDVVPEVPVVAPTEIPEILPPLPVEPQEPAEPNL